MSTFSDVGLLNWRTPPSGAGRRWRGRSGSACDDAVEMYYNASITRWLRMSLDLQVVNPALKKTLNSSGTGLKNVDTAVVGGVRMYIRF
jgi:carbohydrate-selective porin OprB